MSCPEIPDVADKSRRSNLTAVPQRTTALRKSRSVPRCCKTVRPERPRFESSSCAAPINPFGQPYNRPAAPISFLKTVKSWSHSQREFCDHDLIQLCKKKMSQLMKENDCTEYDNCNNNFQSTTCFQSNDKFLSQSPESDPGPDPLLLYVCS